MTKYSNNQAYCPKCPNCGAESLRIHWNSGYSPQDGVATGQGVGRSMQNGHPIVAAVGIAWFVIKLCCKTSYQCKKCNHIWEVMAWE